MITKYHKFTIFVTASPATSSKKTNGKTSEKKASKSIEVDTIKQEEEEEEEGVVEDSATPAAGSSEEEAKLRELENERKRLEADNAERKRKLEHLKQEEKATNVAAKGGLSRFIMITAFKSPPNNMKYSQNTT